MGREGGTTEGGGGWESEWFGFGIANTDGCGAQSFCSSWLGDVVRGGTVDDELF